jgi:thioesterase domain-containing protein
VERILFKFNPPKSSNSAINRFDDKIETEQVLTLLLKAFNKYTPKPYNGKVLMVIGSEQIIHGQREIKYFDVSGLFPYNGWENLLGGQVLLEKMPCDHLDLMENPYCERIGNTIATITAAPKIRR